MTALYMNGMDTMLDDSDFRAAGWTPNPSKAAIKNVVTIPSVSGIPGCSLRPMGPYQSPLNAAAAIGSAAANDLGYFNTGVTVNQAWLAGGITLGFGAKFNSGVAAAYGATTSAPTNYNRLAFDGTLYWTIQKVGSAAYNIATSPDLTNWTVTASQPTTGVTATTSTIAYLGGGIIAVYGTTGGLAVRFVSYTTNNGAAWSTFSLPSAASAGPETGVFAATGNPSFPHVAQVSNAVAGANGAILVGTVGTLMTSVLTQATATTSLSYAHIRVIGGIVISLGSSDTKTIYSANAMDPALNTAAAWNLATGFTPAGVMNDIAYNSTSNLWVLATANGIYTFANTGAAGTPVIPVGVQTPVARYTTAGMTSVYWTGAKLVAVGLAGHIITSPDGLTWTESGGHLIRVGAAGTDWLNSIYDGTRYVLLSDSTTGLVVTTPDLETNYKCMYAIESAEVSQAISQTMNGTALYPAAAAPSQTTGQFVFTTNTQTTYFLVGPDSGGARPLAINRGDTGGSIFTGSQLTTAAYHYYELKYTKNASAANSFLLSVYVDGTLIGSASMPTLIVPSTDTTSLFVAAFQRNGVWTAFDDIYITLDDGIAGKLQGPLGIVNIVARRPTTDVQAQYVRVGSAPSNALSVNSLALSANATNMVKSDTVGDKDIYTSTDVIPAGFTPLAVMTEAYFSRGTSAASTATIGKSLNGSEVDSPAFTVNSATPVYQSHIFETDPTGAHWTKATVLAVATDLTHVS